ncbi:Uncharacterised protein [Yersinia frederiksenii]|nr:Uncharacterised protein [Yersinia frederiksenii]
MAKRIEMWMSEIFPGESEIFNRYRKLPSRELAIVSAAVLDIALAELLSLRLDDNKKEVDSFLGLDMDGMAPAGSFGSRIQLSLLLGIITINDAKCLRTIKDLRNIFAHQVNVSFISPPVVKLTEKLLSSWEKLNLDINEFMHNKNKISYKEIRDELHILPESGEGLLLAVFAVYQAYFQRIHTKIHRVNKAF